MKLATIVAAVLLCGHAGPVFAQSADDLFDPYTLHEIRLSIHSRDLQELRARYGDDTYHTADFQWRGLRVRNVGVRSRGAASRSGVKLALRVDFNRYTTGQEFLGLKSLVLKNLWQDGSMIHERLAMQLFARLGQAVSRETFSRLYINNEYQGLYSIVESVDNTFLARTLGENAGYLFAYQFAGPYHGEYLGDDVAEYRRRFEPENHEREADAILYRPIRDLLREVNQPLDAVWRDRVEQHLDTAQFVTHVAIESFLTEDDGLLGVNGMNNFYMYRPGGTTRHRLLAWDKDAAFHSHDLPIVRRVEDNEIMRKLLTFRDLRELYLQVLEAAARSALEDAWLQTEVATAAALIEEAVREDTRKPFSTEAFFESIVTLQQFAERRPLFVLEQVRLARAVR